MKTITQRLMKILLVTLMMIIPLGINNSVVYAEDTGNTYELKEGVVYKIGDTIELKGNAYISIDDCDNNKQEIAKGKYVLDELSFIEGGYNQFCFDLIFKNTDDDSLSLYLGYGANLTGSETVTGIRCKSGNGTEDNPFRFELTFSKELAEGVEYKIGDTIKLSSDETWVCFDNIDGSWGLIVEAKAGNYPLPEPIFDDGSVGPAWVIEGIMYIESREWWFDLWFIDEKYIESNKPIGIECVSGDGLSQDTAFVFKPVFDNTPSTDPTVIDEISFTVAPPIAGTPVTATWDEENGRYLEDTQNPYPQVNLPDGVLYELDERKDVVLPAYWYDEDKKLFVGEFVAGTYYYAEVWLKSMEGYTFADEPTVTANGRTIEIDGEEERYKIEEDVLLRVYVKVLCVESNYQFTQGNQTYYKGSNKDTEFIIKHKNPDEDGQTYSKFSEFVIKDKDGKKVNMTKDKDYTVTSGSVKITLKSSFLESLDLGTYKITAFFNDGHQVTSSLTIASQPSKPSYSVPKTGVE